MRRIISLGVRPVRRGALAVVSGAALLVLFAGVVLAQMIEGNDKPNTLVATKSADEIRGKGGNAKSQPGWAKTNSSAMTAPTPFAMRTATTPTRAESAPICCQGFAWRNSSSSTIFRATT